MEGWLWGLEEGLESYSLGRVSGGGTFFSVRVGVEPLALAAPVTSGRRPERGCRLGGMPPCKHSCVVECRPLLDLVAADAEDQKLR